MAMACSMWRCSTKQQHVRQPPAQFHATGQHFAAEPQLRIGDGRFEKAGDCNSHQQPENVAVDHQLHAGRNRSGRLHREINVRNQSQAGLGLHHHRHFHSNCHRRSFSNLEYQRRCRHANRTTLRNRKVRALLDHSGCFKRARRFPHNESAMSQNFTVNWSPGSRCRSVIGDPRSGLFSSSDSVPPPLHSPRRSGRFSLLGCL